jgi:hypothetical protein
VRDLPVTFSRRPPMRLATAVLLALLSVSGAPLMAHDRSPVDSRSIAGDTLLAMQLSGQAAIALHQERWEEAGALLELAYGYADGFQNGGLQDRITFFWAYALYKHGESIVLGNTRGDPAEVERALELFTAAMALVNRLISDEEQVNVEVFRLSAATNAQMLEQVAYLDSLRFP